MALQYSSEASWSTVVKRVFEATGLFMPVAAIVLIIVWISSSINPHAIGLYHWMDSHAVAHDELLQHKSGYLNVPFWWIRTIIYIGVYVWFMHTMRKRSLAEDLEGGDHWFFKNQVISTIFIVFFGYTSSTASWDWIMSIDAHWFSTLFGWYTFSGWWISAMTAMTLIILYLKKQGYLSVVNDNHIHDMGKWMFAISFLWTYLWFSQFMLIWYANIPEEATYYLARIADYGWIYFPMIGANFLFPMLILMDRECKRNKNWLWFVGIIIFFCHWVDTYMLVTPGTMKGEGYIGFFELGLFLGFIGLFLKVTFNNLAKAPLVVKNHSYLDESVHFHQ